LSELVVDRVLVPGQLLRIPEGTGGRLTTVFLSRLPRKRPFQGVDVLFDAGEKMRKVFAEFFKRDRASPLSCLFPAVDQFVDLRFVTHKVYSGGRLVIMSPVFVTQGFP
jgi:hypothetical protein